MKKSLIYILLASFVTQVAAADNADLTEVEFKFSHFSGVLDTEDEINEAVSDACSLNETVVLTEMTQGRGEAVNNAFSIADKINYELEMSTQAIVLQLWSATNEKRSHGINVISINGNPVPSELALIDEIVNNGIGQTLIVCMNSNSGYDLVLEPHIEGNLWDHITNAVYKSPGHSPSVKIYIASSEITEGVELR